MRDDTKQLFLCGVASTAAITLIIHLVARRRRRELFLKEVCGRGPSLLDAETVKNLERHRWLSLRHELLQGAVDSDRLQRIFADIVKAFDPQQVDYSNAAYGKNHWQLSCFMEYSSGVAAGSIDLSRGAPLMAVCCDVLRECDDIFLRWYEQSHPCPKTATRSLTRLQSFVTRYTPKPEETHLPRHIDGANVDGSLVLGLPTHEAFEGGGLTVWDGDGESEVFRYPVGVGDVCLLDSRVWHQSNPVLSGERWVIVIFYQVCTSKGGSNRGGADAAATAVGRQKEVRQLLAKRVKDAARRKAVVEGKAQIKAA
uniref:Fe2OG dioxygenase domain-containing protein n=1 Tax=Chrysotila carterae TaxID=13221 RepID=A0A7S4C089_CHRCT|mmetsp:Transcript_35798/g.75229  ORF Transcript_35798/g.75229 Transcript_35798/m.75229 type:complete len:312 (+) Transcript_35798:110-1045(+)